MNSQPHEIKESGHSLPSSSESGPVVRTVGFGAKKLVLSLVLLFGVAWLAIALDIQLLRQLLGFIYVAFVPGLLLLFIFKLHRLSLTVKILLSVGLSTVFFLILGLAFNALSLAVGFQEPLGTTPLLIFFGIITLILAVIAYFTGSDTSFTLPAPGFSVFDKFALLVPVLFPLLAILGTHLMNLSDNNVLLIALLVLIVAWIIFISFYHRRLTESVFPVVVFFISISLLSVLLLRNHHITGADVHVEYYLFNLTSNANHWQIWSREILDSCLVVSLLPAIYNSLIHINPEYLYRIMYIFHFVMTPLTVYVISRRYIGTWAAFLAAFFFMSQLVFVQNYGDARNWIAIFFFALVIMVLGNEQIIVLKKMLLFLIFSVGVILSHYTTAYIFLIVLTSALILTAILNVFKGRIGFITPETDSSNGKGQPLVRRHRAQITFGMVFILIAIIFFWHSQMTGEAFSYGIHFVANTFEQFSSFFILESRTGLVGSALAQTVTTGASRIPMYIELIISWLTIIFIGLGVLATVSRNFSKPGFFSKVNKLFGNGKGTIDTEYLVLALIGCLIILGTVLVPYISQGYDLMRVYFMMIVILAPFFIMGGIVLARLIRIRWAYLMIIVVLVLYFLSTTGITYQVFGAPKVINLSSQSISYDLYYVHEQDVAAARWIGGKFTGGGKVYSFGHGKYILMSQGEMSRSETGGDLYSAHLSGQVIDGYIFLLYPNVVKGKVAVPGYTFIGIDEYRELLDSRNKLYASNGSEVYR